MIDEAVVPQQARVSSAGEAPREVDEAAAPVEAEQGLTPDRAIQIAADAYRASTDFFDASIRTDIERDIRQWQGQFSRDSKYLSDSYKGRSRLHSAKTRASTIKAEAQAAEAMFSSVDVVAIEADDKDDPQAVAAAKFRQALLTKRLTDGRPNRGMPWFITVMGAYQDANVTGVVVSRQYWDHRKKKRIDKPRVDLVPLENFRFDPACDWRDAVHESPYLIHLIPMYVGDIKARIRDGKYRPIEEARLTSAAQDRWDSIRLQRQGSNRTDPQDVTHAVTDFSIVMVHEVIVEIDGEDWVYDTLGTTELLSDPVPLERRYINGRGAFVVGFSTVEAHKHYPSGVPRLTRDLIREHNEIRNKRIDLLDQSLHPRHLVVRNKQVDLGSLRRFMPGASTLVQAVDDVKLMETPDVPAAAFTEGEQLAVEYDDVAGQFSNSSVRENRALNETVGGMNRIAANADQVAAYRLKTFVETWVEPVLRQVVELQTYYEDDPEIVASALIKSGATMIDDSLFTAEHTLSVNVGMGTTSPMEKAEVLLYGLTSIKTLLADGVLQRHGMKVQEVTKEVFAMLGWRDGSRFFAFSDDDPTVAWFQEEIQNLQSQLDAKMPPELLKAQVDKLAAETVTKLVEAVYSAVQTGQAIATVPALAPVSDEVLKSAGFVDRNPAPILPAPTGDVSGLAQEDVFNPRTGIKFVPGESGGPPEDGGEAGGEIAPGNTNPRQPMPPPKPPGPGQGMKQGIETPEADG